MSKKNKKLYFKSIDDTTCYELERHINEAKFDSLTAVTLIEAEPDNDNPDYIFCMDSGEVEERQECKKSRCENYSSKSGRGICSNRGKLYAHGEEATFTIPQSE